MVWISSLYWVDRDSVLVAKNVAQHVLVSLTVSPKYDHATRASSIVRLIVSPVVLCCVCVCVCRISPRNGSPPNSAVPSATNRVRCYLVFRDKTVSNTFVCC